jgi:hypothetical protein
LAPPNPPPCWSRFDGLYTILSRDFDIAAIDANALTPPAEPILLTVSAGNVDRQRGIFPHPECPDYHLTLPPATAKNVLSVGMSESVRPDSHQWTCSFALAEDHDNIASNTKTGTATPGWFKPDLLAPAANIVSNASFDIAMSQPEGFCQNFEAPPPPGVPNEYIASTGTSFAAPAAAGAALLASRYYAQYVIDRGVAAGPSTATPPLLKAMLIAGAQSMRGGRDRSRVFTWQPVQSFMKTGDLVIPRIPNGHVYEATNDGNSGLLEPSWNANAGSLTQDTASGNPYVWREVGPELEVGAAPNSRQGFGRLHLQDVLSRYPARHFVNDDHSVVAGQSWTNTYRIHDATQAVRIALVWADPPAAVAGDFITGSPLVNDLDLFVQFGTQCASRYVGNWISSLDVSNLDDGCQEAAAIDRKNNVEVVRFFAAAGTEFTVRVYGASVTQSQRFALVVLNAYDTEHPAPPGTPAGVLATAASTGSVRVTWSASAGAMSYELQRRDAIDDPYVTVATTSSLLFDDTTVSGGAAYLYRVRARNVTAFSEFSNVDLATTVAFNDNPVAAGQTVIRAAHVLELRNAVNAVRAAAGLAPLAWTDSALSSGLITKAVHVAELRSGLAAARSTLGVAAVSFTDATLTPMTTVIRALHVNELRAGVE